MVIQFELKRAQKFLDKVMEDGNREQGEALKLILETNDNIFITGKAGTGKSTFLREIVKILENKSVVAPTGIAALNINGMTIHSFFGFDMQPYVPVIEGGEFVDSWVSNVTNERKSLIRELQFLIIDEVSMLRCDLLDKIGCALRKIRRDSRPFGGVRLILFGDLYQLPPVFVRDFDLYKYYRTKFFFSSMALKASGLRVIEFKKIYRQSDEDFIEALNSIREGHISIDAEDILSARVFDTKDIPESAIYICSTNKESLSINENMLAKVPGDTVSCVSDREGVYPKEAPCEEVLVLKEGARVVMTKNGDGYVNGSLGVVTKIEPIDKNSKKDDNDDNENDSKSYGKYNIRVLIDGKEKPVKVPFETWSKMEYRIQNGIVYGYELGRISQYPIRLGYSISAHKSQGMTLESAAIKMDKAFEPGQIYTAISRCKSLEGLYLTSMIDESKVMVDKSIHSFWKRVYEGNNRLKPVPLEDMNNSYKSSGVDFRKYLL